MNLITSHVISLIANKHLINLFWFFFLKVMIYEYSFKYLITYFDDMSSYSEYSFIVFKSNIKCINKLFIYIIWCDNTWLSEFRVREKIYNYITESQIIILVCIDKFV